MHEWTADIEVSEPIVRALLEAQHPELLADDATLRLIGAGWDNALFLVETGSGDAAAGAHAAIPADERKPVAVRVPRRAIALPGIAREIDVLPRLAPLLPLPIPVPEWIGAPSDGFPYPWFACRLVPGVELAEAGLDEAARLRIAPVLGTFLRALHDPSILAAIDPDAQLPIDPIHRADMAIRVPMAEAAMLDLVQLGITPRELAEAKRSCDAALRLPANSHHVLVHGDLHLRHVLVDSAASRVTGIIDFGDLCRAPASVDLMIAFTAFGPEAREAFLAAYGPVSPATVLRARVLALFSAAKLAIYGHREGMRTLRAECLAAVRRALD